MGASNEVSFILSLCTSVVLVAGMQVYRSYLASSQLLTILGGYLGSLVFLFMLTAISNLEMSLFGKHFQSKFGEVVFSLFVACFAAGLVHRVSITTCIMFSVLALYYVNRISIKRHQSSTVSSAAMHNSVSNKKKR